MKNEVEIQSIKQRFGIIGSSPLLNRAMSVAAQVAPTDISVLISGESGTGKEVMPKIIHQLSSRKHGEYIAVNCGAIPEGTIDSELFGHEKGAFTGAQGTRLGYFEVANGGTIFLDEVADLPIQTQVRLLRVLETGEFIRVGSSKVVKTDVRVVAASNVKMAEAIQNGKFREDLYYRLNQVPIAMPSLRERPEDVHLLFRKFTTDVGEKYRIPILELDPEAIELLKRYSWPGNIRQLKNITEQMSIVLQDRKVDAETLMDFIPKEEFSRTPMVVNQKSNSQDFSERDLLYKVLFDMKNDLNDVKKLVLQLIRSGGNLDSNDDTAALMKKVFTDSEEEQGAWSEKSEAMYALPSGQSRGDDPHEIEVEESLSLQDTEKELIRKALIKHKNKRKYAAKELGISERTLYRKIKEYNLT
ncbi:MAG: transcriptional regulator with PAS, ATPase and Fis domain [Flavobacteriales bacterium]|jgi:transcriptional regulator with PAS, ATPase and Fis domain